jgi:hypothetical protein
LEGWEIPNAPTSIPNLKSARSAAASDLVNAQVESVNIVGYATVEPTAGKQIMTGAMFNQVGGAALDLQDIRMENVSADAGTILWWWDKDTRTYTYAYWVELYNGDTPTGENGWGDPESWEPMSKTFAPGECFWIQPYAGSVNPKVVTAGELVVSDGTAEFVAVNLFAGKQVQVCNPLPVQISLADIGMSGVDPDAGSVLWWWDKDTRTYTYVYWVELYNGDTPTGQNGWGDPESWEPIVKQFAFGEGFWIQPYAGSTNPKALFKNPFYQ